MKSSISKLVNWSVSFFALCLAAHSAFAARLTNPNEFVKVENGRFVLGGKDFYFVGSNFYRLALSDRFGGQDYKVIDEAGKARYPLVDDVFRGYQEKGIKVVRIWGFACEGSKGHNVTPALLTREGLRKNPVELNEAGFEKLDYVLYAASRYGVKVILPLVNFEHEYCGMEWWVEETLGSSDKHLFYTDQKVWDKFTSYTRAFLERTNTHTGLPYKDDPSIMAIELANEPHTKDFYECTRTGLSEAECQTKDMRAFGAVTLVYEWLRKMSRFVKTIDSNHLIAHGEEGYLADLESIKPECREKHQWIHNGSKGTDFARNASIPDIDFLTNHIYPDNWNIPTSELSWVKTCLFDKRGEIARQWKKPIVLEETGFNERPDGYGQKEYKLDRPYFMSQMFRFATEAGYAGTMVWQTVPQLSNGSPADDDDFTFPLYVYKDGREVFTPEGHAIRLQIQCMNEFVAQKDYRSCISICSKGTQVSTDRFGLDAEGRRCYLPEPVNVGPVELYPSCDNGSADASGWGWTTNRDLCLAYRESAKQYPQFGGCSCKSGF
jgi:mannan endo-1,4-beta-mannosidase